METQGRVPVDPEATIAQPEQRIGKYLIAETLGKGASGTVCRALDTFSGQEVALKVLDERFFTGEGIGESSRQQFMNEASLAGRLQHPHIASILEASIGEKSGYIAVEYVPGGTLARAIRSGKPRKVEEMIEIAFKCCGALDYAHRQGIIHRDLKPANLMLGRDGTVRVLDFGTAKLVDRPGLTRAGTTLGTATYMPPEQLMGKELVPATDLYALGVTLYELCTGQVPFTAPDTRALVRKIHTEPPVPPTTFASDLPKGLEEVILKALAKKPEERFASARDQTSASSATVPPCACTTWSPTTRSCSRPTGRTT